MVIKVKTPFLLGSESVVVLVMPNSYSPSLGHRYLTCHMNEIKLFCSINNRHLTASGFPQIQPNNIFSLTITGITQPPAKYSSKSLFSLTIL